MFRCYFFKPLFVSKMGLRAPFVKKPSHSVGHLWVWDIFAQWLLIDPRMI